MEEVGSEGDRETLRQREREEDRQANRAAERQRKQETDRGETCGQRQEQNAPR